MKGPRVRGSEGSRACRAVAAEQRRRVRRSAGLILLMCVAVGASAAQQPSFRSLVADPALAALLSSAASYVDRFTSAFVNVIAEERYVQDVLSGGQLMVRRPAASREVTHRELRSDLVLVQTGDALGWQMFRDVFEVDGAPVRDREDRLLRVFRQPAAQALEQAARLARESTRYNIGAVERTLNTPVLALLFLQSREQPRFQFSHGEKTPGFSDHVEVVEYREIARPTVIRTVKNGDRPAAGRVWIDGETGAVLQTELRLAGDAATIRFTTLFRHDEGLGVAVPVRMQEEYVLPRSKLVGTASYSRFRQFSVRTDTTVAAPGKGSE